MPLGDARPSSPYTQPKQEDRSSLRAHTPPSPAPASPNTLKLAPRLSRKRTNDEVWDGNNPFTSFSTPKSLSLRPNCLPEGSQHQRGTSSNPFSSLSDMNTREVARTQTMARDQEVTDVGVTSPDPSDPVTTFVQRINEYKAELENSYKSFEEDLQGTHRQSDLERMDWVELERHYNQALEPVKLTEEDLLQEFSQRFSQFQLWIKVSRDQEAERAFKRLRTRMAFVQHTETSLAAKEDHYTKVVNAFQNAMALLANV